MEDSRTLTTRQNIAWIYGLQGRTDEAIELLEKVLEKKQQTFGY
jgi:Tetratricopeptide repeat